jgi:hypothetical protein
MQRYMSDRDSSHLLAPCAALEPPMFPTTSFHRDKLMSVDDRERDTFLIIEQNICG